MTGLRAYIDAVPLANATFGVKGKNEPPDATKTTWSDSNPVISVHNSSLIMHQPNDIETLQCVTLQDYGSLEQIVQDSIGNLVLMDFAQAKVERRWGALRSGYNRCRKILRFRA